MYEKMLPEDQTETQKENLLSGMGSLREELAKREIEAGAIEFINYLLVIDPRKRPSAREALQHNWLQIPGYDAPVIPAPTRPGSARQ